MNFIKINKSDNANTRRAKKSFKKLLKRKLKRKNVLKGARRKKKKQIREKKKRQYIFSPIKYSPEIESFCSSNKIQDWKNHSKVIHLDGEFNLFKNPSRVLGALLSLLYHAKTNRQFITLNYKGEEVSFGALYFIDTICWQIARAKKWYLKLNNLPKKTQIILSNLKSIATKKTEDHYAYIINNRIKINRSEDDLAKQEHKVKSKEIRDLVIEGIRATNKEIVDLPQIAHTAIDSAISEHFDNILLHVPNADYGYLCGCFDKEKKEVIILIYNFGHTIASTLDKNNLPQHVQKVVNEVIANHTKKQFFFNSKFTRENALTLLALQEGISSKLDDDITRGHGLIDFIQHCRELNRESKSVIISGKTAIKIDSTHSIETKFVLGRNRKIIAFNKDNNLFDKPNDEYVVNLGVNFPGVIIETTIPLNSIYVNDYE